MLARWRVQRSGYHPLVPGSIHVAAASRGWLTRGCRHQGHEPTLLQAAPTERTPKLPYAIGVDCHKKTHCAVAVDQTGRQFGEKTVPATAEGHEAVLRWARRKFVDGEITWALEDARHVSGGLERFLLESGERCVRVPTRLMARTRHETAREPGKSDPVDAVSCARAYLREPNLPVACYDDQTRELKLLVDRRDTVVEQRTATWNRVLWRIHELEPSREVGQLAFARHRDPVREWLVGQQGIVAELAVVELDEIEKLGAEANALERRIKKLVSHLAPNLLTLPGVGHLTAAKILGETVVVTRFRGSEAAFARFAGVAPAPRWSGGSAGRMRRTKLGNRNLNSALHRCAVTQLRLAGPGRIYYDKKVSEGHSGPMALRCLKRRISRAVFTRLYADQRLRQVAATRSDGVSALAGSQVS